MAERKPVKPPLAKKAVPKSPAKKKSQKAKKEIKKVNEVKDRDEAKHGSAMFDEKHQKTGKVIDDDPKAKDKLKDEDYEFSADDDTEEITKKLVKAEKALKKAEEEVAKSALDDVKVRDERTKAHQIFQKLLDELKRRADILLNNNGIPR